MANINENFSANLLRFTRLIPAVILVIVLGWYVWYTQFSWAALFTAAHNSDVRRVRIVLARGVPVDITDPMGKGTALMVAAHVPGDVQTCKVLLDNGANVNAKNVFGNTALMLASSSGCTEVVRLLISRGADIGAVNKKGHAALYLAHQEKHEDIVALLEQAAKK